MYRGQVGADKAENGPYNVCQKLYPNLKKHTGRHVCYLLDHERRLKGRPVCSEATISRTPPGTSLLDVGAHDAGDSLRFLAEGGKRVVAVDSSLDALRGRLNELRDRGVTVVRAAIGGDCNAEDPRERLWAQLENGVVEPRGTTVMTAAMWSAAGEATLVESQSVPDAGCTTCADLIVFFGRPDVLKIDINGEDAVCIESLGGLPAALMPQYLSAEVLSTPALEQVLALVESLGYGGFKLVRQGRYSHLTAHLSGPLGEQALDMAVGARWRSAGAVRRDAFFVDLEAQLYAGQYFDLHARWEKS